MWKPKDMKAEQGENEKFLLDGFETKTKQGNKQWVSLAAAAARSNGARSRRRKNGSLMKRNRVVNVMGGEYVMATSGKSLKKVVAKPSSKFTCTNILISFK